MRGNGARRARTSLLERIAGLATRRARLVVVAWILTVGALAFVGRDLDRELSIHPLYIDGTGSKRAHEIALREFGSDYGMVVMLRGPRDAVERQGRALALRLEAQPRMLVISPWAGGGTIDGLSPSPDVAALVVRVESGDREGVSGVLPPVKRQVDELVGGPVQASIAGFPVVIDSLRSASDRATKTGELIAVPVLLIVLLLVFRSVLAAVLPVLVGGAVVAATRGVLSIVHGFVELDLLAIGVVGMMGLALGVDYSLLVVSRFREERRQRRDTAEAMRVTVSTTGRSVIPAGCGLILAMLVAAIILPGSIARSVSIAVIAATVLSMLSALCIVPALLTLAGDNLDRWALPMRQGTQVAPLRWTRRLAARPGAVVAILTALVVLSGWAFTLDSGAASVKLLPPGDAGRQQQEEVEATLGPGWAAPMEVVVHGRGEPVTTPARLRALAAFQRHVEDDPGVASMAGFRPIARQADGADVEAELADQERGLERLKGGVAKLERGAGLNTSGLRQAAEGSGKLSAGIGAAGSGAAALAGGLDLAGDGSTQLANGLNRVEEGGGKLASGTSRASDGAGRLAEALAEAEQQTGKITDSARLFQNAMRSGEARLGELHAPLQASEASLASAWQALQRMTAGRADPEYAAALAAVAEASRRLTGRDPVTGEPTDPAYSGVEAGVERAAGQFEVGSYLADRLDRDGRRANEGIGKLAQASRRLDRGLRRLADGSQEVSNGVGALARGGERLSPALLRLSSGAEHLAGGLDLLGAGAGQLSTGLGEGGEKSALLGDGLARVGDGLQGDEDGGGSGLAELRQRSPGLFRSAYFVLAGLDGTRPRQRSQLGSLINLDRGGMDARMLVIPRDEPTSAAAAETKLRLEQDARDLARRTGAEVVVGGVAPGQIDVDEAVREQAPWMRIALSLVSFLILVPVLRSLTVPILAALINLLTVSATFGLLALLFDGSLLGGPGYVDTTVIMATMMVMFGLAIDYEVFVFARIREEYERTGSTDAAVRNGLDRTAHVVTGAAIIMISVFLAFSVSDFMTIRNFGVAQAIAVFIDAFIVRLIIVPAMMGWLGRWCWWLPSWVPAKARRRQLA